MFIILSSVLIKRVGFFLLLVILWPDTTVTAHVTSSSFSSRTGQQTRYKAQSAAVASNVLTTILTTATATTAPDLPLLDVDFCGECLPFDQTSVVDRWKHVFTLFRSNSSGDLGFLRERADKFFPIIDPILNEYDIPSDFRYIPLAESGLRPKAVSRAGAAGYWQLMPGTARALGLKVNSRVDERFNVTKATTAACRYLRQLYTQLGSWSLVAAAYNAGPGYLKNQLRRTDHRDYYRMSLPRETKYYLFRVLVYKEIMSRPDDYSAFLAPPIETAYQPWLDSHQTYLS